MFPIPVTKCLTLTTLFSFLKWCWFAFHHTEFNSHVFFFLFFFLVLIYAAQGEKKSLLAYFWLILQWTEPSSLVAAWGGICRAELVVQVEQLFQDGCKTELAKLYKTTSIRSLLRVCFCLSWPALTASCICQKRPHNTTSIRSWKIKAHDKMPEVQIQVGSDFTWFWIQCSVG